MIASIRQVVENAKSYALFRLPFSDVIHAVIQDSEDIESETDISKLGNSRRFVMAPFIISEQHPLILLRPEKTLSIKQDMTLGSTDNDISISCNSGLSTDKEKERYCENFSVFHDALNDCLYKKLVLSRCLTIPFCNNQLPECFAKACIAYPRMFVYICHTKKTGIWFGCTPEILLSGKQSQMTTVALAGTRDYNPEIDEEWDEKNKEEQRIVTEYIRKRIDPLVSSVIESEPFTSMAGNLCHIKTEFHFTPKQDVTLGNMISALHPTPAVCGMPQNIAKEFIIANESCDRKYYSGFVGLIDPDGETNLYVNLRCAEISDKCATLYAGSGLLKSSDAETEWNETEKKMKTIAYVLR